MKGEEEDIGVWGGGGQESSQLTISTIGKGDEKN